MRMAKSAERRTEPGPGIQDALTALDAATKTARAECAALAEERTRLTHEIAALKAARDEEQRLLTGLQGQTVVEFLRRCVTAGIDKNTIDELQNQCQSTIAEIDETLNRSKKE
jgi:hypothetical protein